MKPKFLAVLAVFITTVTFADFQYLYWMVDISDLEDDHPEYAFSYATVSAGGHTFDLYDYDGTPTGSTKFGNDNYPDTGFTAGSEDYGGAAIYAGDVSSYVGSTFLFELFSESGKKIAWSQVSGSSLKDYIGGTMDQILTPYTVSVNIIPEPTSGLLMLLGLAGLALKRKRA